MEMSEEVGTGTSVNLKTQTEQMKNTNADVVGVDQSLYRADKVCAPLSASGSLKCTSSSFPPAFSAPGAPCHDEQDCVSLSFHEQ